jgi:hypothetical protein
MSSEYHGDIYADESAGRALMPDDGKALTLGVRLSAVVYGLTSLVWVALMGMLFAGVYVLGSRYPSVELLRAPPMWFLLLQLGALFYIFSAVYAHGVRQTLMLSDYFKRHFAQHTTLKFWEKISFIIIAQVIFTVGTLHTFSLRMSNLELFAFIALSMCAAVMSVVNIQTRRNFMHSYCKQKSVKLTGVTHE